MGASTCSSVEEDLWDLCEVEGEGATAEERNLIRPRGREEEGGTGVEDCGVVS